MSNSIYRVFTENLGGTNVEEFVGNVGEVFYDPEVGDLRVSDGSTAGGLHLTGGGAWVRPADWLAMPTVLETEEKFVGLFAVYDLPENFVALKFEGDYTVDWGDGNIQNFTSGTTAQHSYVWSDIPSSTLTTEGYRQVLVTVTPQTGSNLTTTILVADHDSINYGYSTPWLDMILSMPEATTGTSIVVSQGNGFGLKSFPLELQKLVILNTGNATDLTYAIYFCNSLREVEIRNCSNVEIMSDLFEVCGSLETATFIGATSCSNMTSMFAYCYSLKNVTLTGTSNVTSCYTMFAGCKALISAPLFNTSSVTTMERMFDSCLALVKVPQYNTSSVTNMYNIFDQCYSLVTIPLLNTSLVTNINFGWCVSLHYIPELDASSVTSPISFQARSLQIGALNGTSVTVNYSNCVLGRQAIVDIFNGLATVSGKTINISNNYGIADLISTDYDIATNKGWNVTT